MAKNEQIKLNENKIKLIDINMNAEKLIKIGNVIMEKVNTIKYLGFLINNCLNFREYIEYIYKIIGNKNGSF